MTLIDYASMFEYYGADYTILRIGDTSYQLLEQRQEHWGTHDGIPITVLEGPPEASNTVLANLAKSWLSKHPRPVTPGQRVRVGSMSGVVAGTKAKADESLVEVRFDTGTLRAYPQIRVRPE